MPVPIKPNGGSPAEPQKSSSIMDLLDLSFLGNELSGVPAKSKKFVQASNQDASLLFDLWLKSEDEKLNVSGFDSKEVLRLKARGFITGGLEDVKFTKKGKMVITTMALESPNNFLKNKQNKSYNEILASISNKGKSGMPKYAVNNSNCLNLKEAASAPDGISKPTSNDKYIFSTRLTSTQGTQYKEYTVRVYLQAGKYVIWGFNGRIGGKMTPQFKGTTTSKNAAINTAQNLVYEKKNKSSSDYVDENSSSYVSDPNPSNKPGQMTTEVASELEKTKAPVKPQKPDAVKDKMDKKLQEIKEQMIAKKKAEEEAVAKKKAEELAKQQAEQEAIKAKYQETKEKLGDQDFGSAFEEMQDIFDV